MRRLLTNDTTPWLSLITLSIAFWVIESLIHLAVFGGHGLMSNLFRPNLHELWMRIVVLLMLVAIAFVWSAALRARRRQIERLEIYQRRLRELSARIVLGDGEERRDLSDRLHEQVGQSLAAARLFLASIEEDSCDCREQDALRSVERIVDRAIAECREIAQELSPPVLDEYGLEPALETLANRVMRQTGKSVEFAGDTDTRPPLARETLLAAFQVLAEVVENAASDPRTSTVRVSAASSVGGVSVTVEWDADSDDDLFAITERIREVGGSVERRASELGSTVTLRAPIQAA